jgi:hypothetical protein
MALAAASLRALDAYDFSVIACYHGGAVKRGARRLEGLVARVG